MTRDEVIARLRTELVNRTDEEHCACDIAAQQGIFCRGFARFSDAELRARYNWIVQKFPKLTREQLEGIANDWQLAQQQVNEQPLACDVQTFAHDTCRGWHDFTDEQLASFYRELTGQSVQIA